MTGRERLLAEIEAKRLKQAESQVDILSADLRIGADDSGYDPYDNPGSAKPLDTGSRKPAIKRRSRKWRR